MLTSRRRNEILTRLKREGQIVAKTLSRELGLSEDTIRRDLRDLAEEGLLQRVHGGALPVSSAVAGFAVRLGVASAEKSAIGKAAASLVRTGQIVFVDGGTTAVQLARHLPHDIRATVLTHSPSVAVQLVEHPGLEVGVIGGRLFKHSIVTVGAETMEAIARVRPDIYFMGVTGIHADVGLTTGDLEEAAVKRALCKNAAETVVLASSEKLGAASPYIIVPLCDVDRIVVAGAVPKNLQAQLIEAKIEIVRAS